MTADPTPDQQDPAATSPADPPAEPDPAAATADDRLPDDHPVAKALAKANKEAEAARLKVKEYEDRDKSEQEKLTEKMTAAETRAAEAELRALRLEVAADKGLTKAQAKYLTGTSAEELSAAADELLELFAPGEDTKAALHRKPSERLRGGSNPTREPEETDPRKLAANLPRY